MGSSPQGFSESIGPFIREKLSRGLHKTRTSRINGTKSMFTAYSTQGQLKPRLILAEGFWDGLIQAAAYLGRESVRINALKRCPRLAEAVNDCCACSVFNYIPDLHGREGQLDVCVTSASVSSPILISNLRLLKVQPGLSCSKHG